MNITRWRRALGAAIIVIGALATSPLGATDTPLDRIFRLSQLAPEYERCANSCQATLDQQILNCSGYRPQRSGANATPGCRKASYQAFEACMASCNRFPVG